MSLNVEVANNFYIDCRELLDRYDMFMDGPHTQSRRLKAYIDLRVAYECALKCAVAYNDSSNKNRVSLIKSVVTLSHSIMDLEDSVESSGKFGKIGFERWSGKLESLPVKLRYSLDAYEFVTDHEDLYYETIGSEFWLDSFRSYVDRVSVSLGAMLSESARIIPGNDFSLKELFPKASK